MRIYSWLRREDDFGLQKFQEREPIEFTMLGKGWHLE